VIGAANVFDFLRQSSCVGLWEHYTDRPKYWGHPEGPLPQLVFDGDRVSGLCMKSADNLFPYLAAHMHRKHDTVDLREVGAWKWFFTASMCVLLMMQRMQPGVRVRLSAAMFLALGDFDSLSFLNALSEFLGRGCNFPGVERLHYLGCSCICTALARPCMAATHDSMAWLVQAAVWWPRNRARSAHSGGRLPILAAMGEGRRDSGCRIVRPADV